MAGQDQQRFPTDVAQKIRFDIKVHVRVHLLRRDTCRASFILAHGPRAMELELCIKLSDGDRRNRGLELCYDDDLIIEAPGIFELNFGASKDAKNFAKANEVIKAIQPTDFIQTYIMPGEDEFVQSLYRIVRSPEYEKGIICFNAAFTYLVTDFTQFIGRKDRLRSLGPAEREASQKIVSEHQDFEVLSTSEFSVLYPKWMLYIGTKYFHRIIDKNPAAKRAKLNYPHDVITYALRLALHNNFAVELYSSSKKIRDTIELVCLLEPLNVDIVIEMLAIELEFMIFEGWEQLDLDELVRILLLPKYMELEHLKRAVRSIINDVYYEQFREEYNENSTGVRCELYQKLISSDVLDEASPPMKSELQKLDDMNLMMKNVRKTIR